MSEKEKTTHMIDDPSEREEKNDAERNDRATTETQRTQNLYWYVASFAALGISAGMLWVVFRISILFAAYSYPRSHSWLNILVAGFIVAIGVAIIASLLSIKRGPRTAENRDSIPQENIWLKTAYDALWIATVIAVGVLIKLMRG